MSRIIAVTGADGFVGKNLMVRLAEHAGMIGVPLTRSSTAEDWRAAMQGADTVIHLAGVNRPADEAEFAGNSALAQKLTDVLEEVGRPLPVILASSTRAGEASAYGESKRAAEDALTNYGNRTRAPVAIYRLPNIFGKWCKPNYNSAVATFCHNLARGLPIRVNDASSPLTLVYVDDVIDSWLALLERSFETGSYSVTPEYQVTVGEVAEAIRGFATDRAECLIGEVGTGLTRALYATFISYLPADRFAYPLTAHRDPRGTFSEMLKTRTSGQFSYFNALPRVTRGGHYHHTKTEKFLVVHGEALFRFRHVLSGETHEVRTSAAEPVVVETIPGWAHDVTNIGDDVMVSLLWANEIFDRDKPDTIAARV